MDEFLEHFINKHGKVAFLCIKNKIKEEVNNSKYSTPVDEGYLSFVFRIAVFQFCKFDIVNIEMIINEVGINNRFGISVEEVMRIHKGSINLIKKYMKQCLWIKEFKIWCGKGYKLCFNLYPFINIPIIKYFSILNVEIMCIFLL